MTKCQQEAAGLGQTSLISFRPQCDDQGAYIPQQCWQQATVCWCVDSNGIQLPDSVAQGSAQCNTGKIEMIRIINLLLILLCGHISKLTCNNFCFLLDIVADK